MAPRWITVMQTATGHRLKAAKRKLCSISFYQLLFVLMLYAFVVLNCLIMKSMYRNYPHYFNMGSLLNRLIGQRNTTNNATTKVHPPPPEYKSPGRFFVEYPYKYNFIINEAKRCEEVKPYLVLIVPVAPQNREDRQIIRNTWGAQKVVLGKNVTLFFLLGLGKVDEKEISEESKLHGDILQSDFIDCYKNLSIKTMVMLEWLDAHCRNATYAMKIDTDVFLNLPNLVQMLQKTPKTNYLTGAVEWAAYVKRHNSSKWLVPFDLFIGNKFPPYVHGIGYVLSLDLAKKLVDVASREKKILYIEDVYLGMCMQRLGLQPTNPPNRGAFLAHGPKFDRCQYSSIIATTFPERTDKLQLWRSFTAPGPHCKSKT